MKRAAYRAEDYWGLPVPSLGPPGAAILIVGLAPGAHGANRTGRLFTGDSSGDFLFASLHRLRLANQPLSRSRDDGLELHGAFLSAAARCAPPGNRPSPEEMRRCLPYLSREIALLSRLRVIVALGGIAFSAVWAALEANGIERPRPRPRFGHCVVVPGEETGSSGMEGAATSRVRSSALRRSRPIVVASYHPSRQNTQTGRLTAVMLDQVFSTAREQADL